MRRLAAVLVALSLAASAYCSTQASAAGPPIYVRNTSAKVTDTQVQAAIPALQAQIDRDIGPAWHTYAELSFIGQAAAPAGGWSLTITDDQSNCPCYGYHDLDGVTPFGFVFPADDGTSWTQTASHELAEMLVDPFIDNVVRGPNRLWLVEVADPVEDVTYKRLGVTLSDFVTPAWYCAACKHATFDHVRKVKRPFKLLPGGYASYWSGGVWRQVFG